MKRRCEDAWDASEVAGFSEIEEGTLSTRRCASLRAITHQDGRPLPLTSGRVSLCVVRALHWSSQRVDTLAWWLA